MGRFIALDGLRGVAALVVLLFHLVQQHDTRVLPFAGLAVDFFYVLSGFVLAYAYGAKLGSGAVSWGGFLRIRLERLYPLLALGTGLGIALAVVAAFTRHSLTLIQVAEAGALGLLALPSYVFPQWASAYPFDMAAWSLTFEGLVNALWAALARLLTAPRLIALVAASAAILVWIALVQGAVAGGNNQANWAYGLGRVLFPFFAGVLLFRWRPARRPGAGRAAIACLVLVAALLAPGPRSPLAGLAEVLVLFPLLVWWGAGLVVEGALGRLFTWLGELSYPVYILQGPLIRLGDEWLRRRRLGFPAEIAFALAEAAVILLIAWLAVRRFDRPIQRALRARHRHAPPTPLVLPAP